MGDRVINYAWLNLKFNGHYNVKMYFRQTNGFLQLMVETPISVISSFPIGIINLHNFIHWILASFPKTVGVFEAVIIEANV